MRLTKKQLVVGVAAVVIAAAGGATIGVLTAPDAAAHPGHGNCEATGSQSDHPCDPLTFILGEPPVPASDATTWQELLLPPEDLPVLGARIGWGR